MVTTPPVTIEQAAAILNVSASTIRRRIKVGMLRVEETHRPRGVIWLVHLPSGTGPASETATVDTAPVDTTAATPTTQAEALTGLVQATVATVLGPLVGELAASRQTIERQSDQLVSQAEIIGQLRAEAVSLGDTIVRLSTPAPPVQPPAPEPATEPAAPHIQASPAWWRTPWLLVVIVLAICLVAVLVWPR